MIKSFRGKVADGEIQRIKLSTSNGLTGYKMVKLFIVGEDPEAETEEFTVKVFTIEPSSVTASIDFNDPTLLAMAYLDQNSSSADQPPPLIVFDQMKFNQDIYVTNKSAGGRTANFYIELEQFKFDINEATVATLKDMRGRE